jgi:hypothetical protein
MDESTKSSRRIRWQNYNFAGTIDWAVDLQAFSDDDKNHIPDRPKSGQGCVSGEDDTLNTSDLCAFACAYGFCPETLCTCTHQGDLEDLPEVKFDGEIEAWLPSDVDINRLCKFGCKYGYCPDDVCIPPVIDEEVDEDNNPSNTDWDTLYTRDKMQIGKCLLWKGITQNDQSTEECKTYCSE